MEKNETSKRAKAPKKSNKATSTAETDIEQDADDYFTLSLLLLIEGKHNKERGHNSQEGKR
jgi:hypothetical protein